MAVPWLHGAPSLQMLHASKMYGYTVGETSFDWGKLKEMRDAYVQRLNGIYHRNVVKSGVTLVYGVSINLVCLDETQETRLVFPGVCPGRAKHINPAPARTQKFSQ